ncbi:hypothetical protein AN478_03945 [Thiohalorhabdus denitrificans]|uniref:Uncharacterized protein n=1 Tax=Thiohalorhabdus denitrificans TaxID=381306 RepID=A0A0P9ERG0_9GAMM|nr:hypothetical protein [Thiohalorhabdus denitrificans]KPV41078.1 hypothetical protein AN478_03945 [Thiohalorhabdus denitrificans]SCY39452.1 hypothetical protein SAMN05661077_1989 [Thiohalorhabdus denitrificans]
MAQRSRTRYSVAGAAAKGVEGGLPRPLYEALPVLYIGAAVAFLYLVESPLVFLSSALFGAAGMGVLWMRFQARRGG